MAERVNKNVDWLVDDTGLVTGYQRFPGDKQSFGAVSDAGKRDLAARIDSGNSRAANALMPTTSFGWNRLWRNIFRASNGLVYGTATAAHGLTNGAYVYTHNVGISNYELNNVQCQIATLSSIPADVAAYVAADGGTATTANTVVFLDAPAGSVNTLAANAGNYTLEMTFGMGGAASFANAYMGHRFKKVINIAKGGSVLADWLLDIDTIITHPALPKVSYTDILTNDWNSGGLADSQSAVDTLIGLAKEGIARILNANMLQVVPNLIPVVTMTATKVKNLDRFNRGIAAELWTMEGVIGSDHYKQVVTSTGIGNVAYFFSDQFHLAGSGNARVGREDATVISAALPALKTIAPWAVSPKNALANPWMTGSAGVSNRVGAGATTSANSDVGTGWTISVHDNPTQSAAKYTTIFPWQQYSTPTAWAADTVTAQWKTVYNAAKTFCFVASSVTGTFKTHATTEPTWPTTLFGTVVDNEVTWTCVPYVNDGTLARIQGIRAVAGGTLLNNSYVRLSQSGITLASLAGTDAAIAVGDRIQAGALVRIYKNPTVTGIQGVNLLCRGETANDGSFACGRDLSKDSFLNGNTDAVLWPAELTLETNPDYHLPSGQSSLNYTLEFVIGPVSAQPVELIAQISQPFLSKAS